MSLRKVCDQYRPYSNCVTLKGQLSNWTSEDIIQVATDNIEQIIEPIRSELAEQTIWNDIGQSDVADNDAQESGYGQIGDNAADEAVAHKVNKNNISDKTDEGYEWYSL